MIMLSDSLQFIKKKFNFYISPKHLFYQYFQKITIIEKKESHKMIYCSGVFSHQKISFLIHMNFKNVKKIITKIFFVSKNYF